MPLLNKITNTFFVDLINRLGVRPAFIDGFLLSNVVQPVSIVDTNVQFQAVQTSQTLGVPATQGIIASPVGAGVLLADTGPLPVGIWSFFMMVSSDFGGSGGYGDFFLQRRDAANATNIWTQSLKIGRDGENQVVLGITSEIVANERIRLITNGAWTVGITAHANIWSKQLV